MSMLLRIAVCVLLTASSPSSRCSASSPPPPPSTPRKADPETEYEFPRESGELFLVDPNVRYNGTEKLYSYALCSESLQRGKTNCTVYNHAGKYIRGCNMDIESPSRGAGAISLKYFGSDKVILKWLVPGNGYRNTLRVAVFEMDTCEVVDLSFAVDGSAGNIIAISGSETFDVITSGRSACNGMQSCRIRYDHVSKKTVKVEPFNVKLGEMVAEYLGENLFVRGSDLVSKDYKLMLITPDGSSKTFRTLKDHAQVLSSNRGELYVLCYTNYYGDEKNLNSYTTAVRCSQYDSDGYAWMNKAVDLPGYVTLERVEGLDAYEILLIRERNCFASCSRTLDINEVFAYDEPEFHSRKVGCSDGERTLAFGAKKVAGNLLVDYVCEKTEAGDRITDKKVIFQSISLDS